MFTRHEESIVIDGVDCPVDTDFRLMCEYSAALLRKDRKALCDIAVRFFYCGNSIDGIQLKPESMAAALDKFYADGFNPHDNKRKSKGSSSKAPSFDFEEDEAYFFSAFLSEYGIDLRDCELHWFDFCALFLGLPDECKLKQIIGIRATVLGEVSSQSEKRRIKRLKDLFALSFGREKQYQTKEERDAAMRAEIQRRHAEVSGRKE